MYESPINQILGEMQIAYEDGCMKAVQNVGFDVNKEELIKALQYDRGQYEKGYADGYAKAIDEFVNKAWETLGSEDSDIYARESILEIAEKMKGGV